MFGAPLPPRPQSKIPGSALALRVHVQEWIYMKCRKKTLG